MKNIKNLFKINITTYLLILTFLFTGLIKNIILIYLIIIIHELGHIFTIKKLGYKIQKIELYPSGGLTTIEKKINTPIIHDLLISISGIIAQIFLFFIFLWLYSNSLIRSNTFNLFKVYNKTIIIFNLLPLISLDGYQILKCFLEKIFPYKLAFYLSYFIGLFSLISFFTYNYLFSLNNYLIISYLIFRLITTLKDFKYNYFKFLLERFLYQLPFKKIEYSKDNINLLKKEVYHYFRKPPKIISEKEKLAKMFDNNS